MQVPDTVPGGYPEYPDPLRDGSLAVVVTSKHGAAKQLDFELSMAATERALPSRHLFSTRHRRTRPRAGAGGAHVLTVRGRALARQGRAHVRILQLGLEPLEARGLRLPRPQCARAEAQRCTLHTHGEASFRRGGTPCADAGTPRGHELARARRQCRSCEFKLEGAGGRARILELDGPRSRSPQRALARAPCSSQDPAQVVASPPGQRRGST